MSTSENTSDDYTAHLIVDYLERQDRGETIDRGQFLSQSMEVSDSPGAGSAEASEAIAELTGFWEAADLIEQMAGPTWGEHLRKSLADTQSFFEGDATQSASPPLSEESWRLSSYAGELQLGRYRIERQLGQGAMGAVFLAHDTQLDRPVALKFPTVPENGGVDRIERFYREARAAAALRHPHLCPVYDVGEIDGVYFLAMAYIEGEPLSKWIDPARPVSPRRAASIVRTLAAALDKAHQQGVIHRDLKPSNILMDRDGQPVVTDFGLACFLDRRDLRDTQPGVVVGSPAYMAPEQFAHGQATCVTDIYSLGIVLAELLIGRHPHQGSVWSIIGQAAHQRRMNPEQSSEDIWRAVPPPLASVLQKMIAPRPEDRYQTMAEAAHDLEEYLENSQPPRRIPTPFDQPSVQSHHPVGNSSRQREKSMWALVETTPKPAVRSSGAPVFAKHGKRKSLIIGGVLAIAFVVVTACIYGGLRLMWVKRTPSDFNPQAPATPLDENQQAPTLRYGWRQRAEYAYQFDIEVEDGQAIESLRGSPIYRVQKADQDEARLTFHGGLISHRIERNQIGIPVPRLGGFSSLGREFGGLVGGFPLRPHELVLDRQGRLKHLRGDSQLPFSLGNLSLLAVEPLPDKPARSWTAKRQVRLQVSAEQPAHRYGRFPPIRSPFHTTPPNLTDADETIKYVIHSQKKDRVVLRKTYLLASTQTLGGRPRYTSQGQGEVTFDLKQRIPVKGRMNLQVRSRNEFGDETVRVSIQYRWMDEKELAAQRAALRAAAARAAQQAEKAKQEKNQSKPPEKPKPAS